MHPAVQFAAPVAFMLASTAAIAQDDILIVNNATGYDISNIYISESGNADWEEDILGMDILPDGTTLRVDMTYTADVCYWDILIVYSIDGEQVMWPGLDFCNLGELTIVYDEGSGDTSVLID